VVDTAPFRVLRKMWATHLKDDQLEHNSDGSYLRENAASYTNKARYHRVSYYLINLVSVNRRVVLARLPRPSSNPRVAFLGREAARFPRAPSRFARRAVGQTIANSAIYLPMSQVDAAVPNCRSWISATQAPGGQTHPKLNKPMNPKELLVLVHAYFTQALSA
jgi:hypothetical protein